MENYYYKCHLCGYIHQIPAYWLSFSPTKYTEVEHANFKTCEICTNTQLEFDESIKDD